MTTQNTRSGSSFHPKHALSRILLLIAILATGIGLMVFPPARIPVADDIADTYFEETIRKAGLAYGTARLVNAGVSVVKESSLQLEPGGVGIAVAVGQVADPLDDMTERLSSMLVTAIVSLLVQKICFEIAQAYVFQVLGGMLVLCALLSIDRRPTFLALRNLVLRMSLFLMILRLFLPVSALMSDFLNRNLFFPKIDHYHASLVPVTAEFSALMEYEMPEIGSLREVFSEPAKAIGNKTRQLKQAASKIVEFVANEGMEVFNTLLKITAIYLGVFLVQVLFIPLGMFWFMNKLLFILFGFHTPAYITGVHTHQSDINRQTQRENTSQD